MAHFAKSTKNVRLVILVHIGICTHLGVDGAREEGSIDLCLFFVKSKSRKFLENDKLMFFS